MAQTTVDYASMNMDALKDICRENGFAGFSAFKKAGLVEFVMNKMAERADPDAAPALVEPTAEPVEVPAEAPVEAVVDYASMNMDALKDICRENDFKGFSKFKKAGLAEFVANKMASLSKVTEARET